MPNANDWTTLVLPMVLQLTTSPVSATLISRSVYRSATRPVEPLS
jgi:multisubunit Na+/H+ antiporter MnhG subunit